MAVSGLDHVNIVTTDLAGTKRFYRDLLDMGDAPTPDLPPGTVANWLADAAGRPIIHLQQYAPEHHGTEIPSGPTGALDHVALQCVDFDGTVARCEALGVDYRVNVFAGGIFRQVFVTDPNGILLELNFPG